LYIDKLEPGAELCHDIVLNKENGFDHNPIKLNE